MAVYRFGKTIHDGTSEITLLRLKWKSDFPELTEETRQELGTTVEMSNVLPESHAADFSNCDL